jgi:hypothetical protein
MCVSSKWQMPHQCVFFKERLREDGKEEAQMTGNKNIYGLFLIILDIS